MSLGLRLSRAAAAATLLVACAGSPGRSRPPQHGPGIAPPAQHPRLELLESTDRPAIARVNRGGDPLAGVAVAVAHDGGSVASVALAGLVEARLRPSFPDAITRPHDLGLVVSHLVADPQSAVRFTQSTLSALSTPVAAGDPAVEEARKKLAALVQIRGGQAGDDPIRRCSGELAAGGPLPKLDGASLESMRDRSARTQGVSVGVLGARGILDAVTHAVQSGAAWPEGGPEDPWPTAGRVYGTATASGGPSLSVALRLDDGARAIAAARALGRGGSERLRARLSALSPEFRVERIAATTRPRGACLRIDLTTSDSKVSAEAAAWAALITEREALSVAPKGSGAWWDIEDGVLRASDPREAAAVAAWRALSGKLVAKEPLRFVRFSGPRGAQLQAQLSKIEARKPAEIETRTRVESGQGELWLLAASDCGVAQESESDSGITALMLTALAQAAAERHHDIVFEPWISPDHVGLMAHGPRQGPGETEQAHAQRIGDALGWALAGTRLKGPHVAEARTSMTTTLSDVSGSLRPTLLSALSPMHPSWLEPRGTFTALSGHTGHAAEARRRTWLSEPLRLAILSSGDPAQTRVVQEAFASWVLPGRGALRSCPSTSGAPAKTGQLEVDGPDKGQAVVAVPLTAGAQREAHWLAFLMNRPGGLLDHALGGTRLGRGRAQVIGGTKRGALLVEVHGFPETFKDAIAQVRALLSRLASGALVATDFERAREHFARVELRRSLDPRERLARTWGAQAAPAPSLNSLRRFCQLNLAASRHLVVRSSAP